MATGRSGHPAASDVRTRPTSGGELPESGPGLPIGRAGSSYTLDGKETIEEGRMHAVARPSGPAPLAERVRARRAEILRLLDEAGARDPRLFGSVARGTAGPDSDLDLVVDLPAPYDGMRYLRLLLALEDLLGCRVDLVTTDGLPPRLRAAIEREAAPL
jgi:predicted nucleotidyltransferase